MVNSLRKLLINYNVEKCERNDIKDFIEKWHYSHNMNGVISTYCFKLLEDDKIIGAAVFGWLAMANQWKKYTDSKNKLIELRRLCCIDDTVKNTESFFISKCIRWLRCETKIEKIIEYIQPVEEVLEVEKSTEACLDTSTCK